MRPFVSGLSRSFLQPNATPLYRGSLLVMNVKQVEDRPIDTWDVSHWVMVNKAATDMGTELFV